MRTGRPASRHIVDNALQESGEVRLPPGLARALIAGELQRGADHGVHLGDGGQHLVPLLRILDGFGPQPQQRQRRAQIVRDGRQQARPVLDQAAQARLHGVEGTGRLPRLDGAGLRQRRSVDIMAEPFGGRCQRGKGCGHAADGPHGHGENDDRHDTHGQQELTRERGAACRQGGRKREPLAIRQRESRPADRESRRNRRSRASWGHAPSCARDRTAARPLADADTRGCRAVPRDS